MKLSHFIFMKGVFSPKHMPGKAPGSVVWEELTIFQLGYQTENYQGYIYLGFDREDTKRGETGEFEEEFTRYLPGTRTGRLSRFRFTFRKIRRRPLMVKRYLQMMKKRKS